MLAPNFVSPGAQPFHASRKSHRARAGRFDAPDLPAATGQTSHSHGLLAMSSTKSPRRRRVARPVSSQRDASVFPSYLRRECGAEAARQTPVVVPFASLSPFAPRKNGLSRSERRQTVPRPCCRSVTSPCHLNPFSVLCGSRVIVSILAGERKKSGPARLIQPLERAPPPRVFGSGSRVTVNGNHGRKCALST